MAFGIWYFAIRTPEPADDLGRFQGDWALAVPAAGGDGQPAGWLKPVTVRVAGDRWVYVADGRETRRYQMTLRPDASPKEIDLVQLQPDGTPLMQQWPPPTRPVTIRGVYEIEGGRAKVVTGIGDENRPKSLDETEGVTVWLLERVE